MARVAFGGDYNPEQWPEPVWAEDVALMREAGVTLVTVGVFAWSHLEPRPGEFTFDWLDRVLDLLHDGGVSVDLGTPTAAPPPWFLHRNPGARPVTRTGTVLGGGARQSFCPSSPAYAQAVTRITGALADRYGHHPAVVMWHVNNEYGNGVDACYCDGCAAAFRGWLRTRYGDLDALNTAWGTSFWSQRYDAFDEITPPRASTAVINPAQELDFARFANDRHLANYRREREILKRRAPDTPVTTNFMLANCKSIDYWKWAREVDVVANDHYLQAERADNHIELAMCADLTRAVADGAPWILMEHSTGAVNWQPRNIAKRPGELARNSLAHLARGADGLLFFQWRASRFGAEKFHSAMVPHQGTGSRIWREVTALGADLARLKEVVGSRVLADVALVWDWESWWALELDARPSSDLRYRDRVEAYYERLWRAHQTTDFVHPEGDLGRYRLVVVPSLYLTTPAAAKNLTDFVRGGGTLVVSYFSGIVDATDTVHAGGALSDVLGVRVQEFLPLRAGESVAVGSFSADVWAEDVELAGAVAVMSYVDGPAAGRPAVTRHRHGFGHAWYVSTRLDAAGLDAVLTGALADAGIAPVTGIPDEVEVVRRTGGQGSYLVAINHGSAPARLSTPPGHELFTDLPCPDGLPLPGGAVRVLRVS
ncbi:beta-galactosidase [Virgisporangium ochraceum]|uniref:Beta-galactosidase n=1 Tax=Virgisporangium ochraceum TaxID=65505 RepID=A0A8J4ED75_9ACTN|nr:beta-galactosidase [Virgisporangium ochraceum]GIJ67647.1 beta-galactosidase [Virgisporangium ochraceum]